MSAEEQPPPSDSDLSLDESSFTQSNHSGRALTSTQAGVSFGTKRESRQVVGIKSLFVIVLLLSAAGALGVHFYIKDRETNEFEAHFYDDATKVMAAVGDTLEFSLQSADAFVASIVSMAQVTNQEWPFVTVPNWAARAGKIRSLTGAMFLNIYPLVEDHQREAWENYTSYNNDWVYETQEAQESDPTYEGNTSVADWYENWDVIHGYDEFYKDNAGEFGTNRSGPYLPYWQVTPVLLYDPVYNWDLTSDWDITNCSEWEDETEPCEEISTATDVAVKRHKAVLSEGYLIQDENSTEAEIESDMEEANWIANYLPPNEEPMEPVFDMYYPILPSAMDTYNQNADPDFDLANQTFAGMLAFSFYWRNSLRDILPDSSNGIIVVVDNPCNPTFTYEINGPTTNFLGGGDHHQDKYDHLALSANLLDFAADSYTGVPVDDSYCPWSLRVYPSDAFREQYDSQFASIFTIVATVVFLLTTVVFLIYDLFVERRQKRVVKTAKESEALVSNLFPSSIRARMSTINQNDKPVADTFADCTVAFIDIVGFTSWSSVRDPQQVFRLLESLYGAYDSISERRGVFKVETIGDSYVAVTGLPRPQKNHAAIMVRFACEARAKMQSLVQELELELGPGTADLKMRVGLHSGPVTAGVLRGQKARFQLFGDTVNTAARMESTGTPGKIHVSRKTAQELGREGKGHWVTEREELVAAKGKGFMSTWFAEPQHFELADQALDAIPSKSDLSPEARLIDWNVAVLADLLKSVVAHHKSTRPPTHNSRMTNKLKDKRVSSNTSVCSASMMSGFSGSGHSLGSGKSGYSGHSGACVPLELFIGDNMIRDEVLDTIPLPTYNEQKEKRWGRIKPEDVDLGDAVLDQLRAYVTAIAAKYPPNAFHNYEHASHVMMSAKKLLLRVTGNVDDGMTKEAAHYQSYGIGSDPLTQFAIVFSALAHDVEHPGVANGQLVKEETKIAKKYEGKSVAEQHSVAVAWELLMEKRFRKLHACIFPDEKEKKRFRQVLINAVVTTDIFDKELKAARESRWENTYGETAPARSKDELEKNIVDRKATIVIELVIQASDVSHTMQHWHVYQHWNHKLLKEQYTAYKAGRLEKNPLEGWYGGELWFFDNYIIPLATKMRDCQVFGVSCDEFLDFATDNRLEWANKGEGIVAGWAETIDKDCEDDLMRIQNVVRTSKRLDVRASHRLDVRASQELIEEARESALPRTTVSTNTGIFDDEFADVEADPAGADKELERGMGSSYSTDISV